jgi:hypothetical protein
VLVTVLAWSLSHVLWRTFADLPSVRRCPFGGDLGVQPICLETAGRHLVIGKMVLLDHLSQIGSILANFACVLINISVWALVLASV